MAKNAAARNPEDALPDDSQDDVPGNEDERDLEPTTHAVVDAAYDPDGEDDDVLELGIQLGKMRMTERVGGFFRPQLSQEVCVPLCSLSFVNYTCFFLAVLFKFGWEMHRHLRNLHSVTSCPCQTYQIQLHCLKNMEARGRPLLSCSHREHRAMSKTS